MTVNAERAEAATLELEPAWEIATLFPQQGAWSEGDYLMLDTNRLIELGDGRVEVLLMPTQRHQLIAAYLFTIFLAFSQRIGGTVCFAPLSIRLRPGKFREPNVVFMLPEHAARRTNDYWEGADLVVEVVSGAAKDRRRDLVIKRTEYAQAGIPEYWIVDPETEAITVLRLDNTIYAEYGIFGRGTVATSATLPGLVVAVDNVFDIPQ